MRISFDTLVLLARSGDEDAMVALKTWQSQEDPQMWNAKREAYFVLDPIDMYLILTPPPQAYPIDLIRSRIPTLLGLTVVPDQAATITDLPMLEEEYESDL